MAEETPTGGERTEAPTAKRRQEFRDKGQVAQSKEVHTAALLTITLAFWIFYMPTFYKGLRELISGLWQTSGQFQLNAPSVVYLGVFVLENIAFLIFPLFILVLV
ncbi:MAG: EscU/YscU/HrcU family type III secretion system export apparatus switch protein, partial [Deltaproteobacteria bacterium]|nr:EscU/YscU/HrcU family type III secretion system export apparatus switch protein [Deltaproteobacteria bacterium]